MEFNTNCTNLTIDKISKGFRLGIDTHADTSCAGKHVRERNHIDWTEYNIVSSHPDYSLVEKLDLINEAIAIDNDNGTLYHILKLKNFLDFIKSLDHFLLYHIQVRANGAIIDDVPNHLDETSTQSTIFK